MLHLRFVRELQKQYEQGGELRITNGVSDPRVAMANDLEGMGLATEVALGAAGTALLTGGILWLTEYVEAE